MARLPKPKTTLSSIETYRAPPEVDEEAMLLAPEPPEEDFDSAEDGEAFEFDALDAENPVTSYSEAEDGDFEEIDLDAEELEASIANAPFEANLAELMDEDELSELGSSLMSRFEADIESASEWREIYKEGLELLGFDRQQDETDFPFEGACTVTHPLLAESIVKYQSKARSQILPPEGPAKVKLFGDYSPELQARAQRVQKYMNFHIKHEMSEYETEHDRMLFYQAYFGSGITKSYFDGTMGRCRSVNVSPVKFVINYNESDLDSAECYGEIIDISHEELERQLGDLYRDIDLRSGSGEKKADEFSKEAARIKGHDDPEVVDEDMENHTLYEIHCYLDDIEDIYAPYIVTIHQGSGEILSIYRNWEAEDPLRKKLVYYTHWPFIPGFGFFGFGHLHLIGGLSDSSTKILRQLIDAGTFSNFPGGFKAHGLRLVGDDEPLTPGEWREINVVGTDLQRALLPLPYKEPSATLVNLLQFVVEAGQRFADSAEEVVSQSKNYGPVNTTLALMEASGKMFTAIHERLFEAQSRELKTLYRLIRINALYENYPYDEQGTLAEDFANDFNVVSMTDPRQPTEAHRLARTYAHFAIAQQAPQDHNMKAILADLHTQLGAEDAQRYIKQDQPPPPPMDPITEVQAILMGQPVQPYEWQDHTSYIKVINRAVVQNPQYQKAQPVIAAATAQIMRRMALRFRNEMQQVIGQPLPPLEQMTPEMQNQIAFASAQAVDALLGRDIKRAVEEAAEARTIDPVLQIEDRKLDIEQEKNWLDYDADMAKELGDQSDADEDRILDMMSQRLEKSIADQDRRADIMMNREDNKVDMQIAKMRPKPTSGGNK